MFWGSINKTIYNLFPVGVRHSGVALSDSLARSLFAGTTPLIGIYTLQNSSISFVFLCLFLIFLCFIILLIKLTLIYPEKRSLFLCLEKTKQDDRVNS